MHSTVVAREERALRAASAGIMIALATLSLLPTLLVDIPAMGDYPNHLARMHLLANVGTANENPYYVVLLALYPNLAMDLVVPRLAKLMDVETATRLFFFFGQLLIVGGAIVLEYVVKRRHEIGAFGALLALHSMPFSLGLVNFEFGMGLALFGIAGWIACRQLSWPLRLAVHAVFVCLLLLTHFFALGIYGLTLGLYELHRMVTDRVDLRRAAGIVVILAAPVMVLLPILYRSGGAIGGSETEWLFSWKLAWVAFFLNGYDVYLAATSMAVLLLLLGYLAFKRSLTLSSVGRWVGIGLLITFILMPFKLFDSRMADIRVIVALFLILPAFVTVQPKRQLACVAVLVVSAIIAVNASYAAYVWLSYRADYADIKTSFGYLKRESFVLVGSSREGEVAPTLLTDVPINRAPVLAVHHANAFVSLFYTIAGMQPVEVRPELRHLDVATATEDYHPPSLAMLRAAATGQDVKGLPGYMRNWTRDFQFVYLVGPHKPDPLPGVLEELARFRRFSLYAVRNPELY